MLIRLALGIVIAAFAAAPAVAAAPMDVATALAKADALQKKGMLALFSADMRLLKQEVGGDVDALEREAKADGAAGRKPLFCPPKGGSINSNEILAALRAVPPAARARTSVKDALRPVLARRFPCR
jgi:hypothetical protein